MATVSLQQVRSVVQNGRVVRKDDIRPNRIAKQLIEALRGDMRPAGHQNINVYLEDEYETAQALYRSMIDAEPPVFPHAKFRIGQSWYMYDQARPLIRRALELHLPKGKRSSAAQWLAVALRSDTLDDYAVVRAESAAMAIYENLNAV